MRQLGIIVSAALILGSLSCGPSSVRAPYFSASGHSPIAQVRQDCVTFWMPIRNMENGWSRNVRHGSIMEYYWAVRAKLLGNVYDFGYAYYADPTQPEVTGTFDQLLKNGGSGVWVLAPSKRAATALPEYEGIAVAARDQGLIIQITQSKFVRAFQEERPRSVLFVAQGLRLTRGMEQEEVFVQYLSATTDTLGEPNTKERTDAP